MKPAVAFAIAAAALAAVATSRAPDAVAADGGGLAGYVVDGSTGHGLPGERVSYFRLPYVENSTVVAETRTNSRGYFGDITLTPGRYVLSVGSGSQILGCVVEDVFSGEVSRVRISLARLGAPCTGPRPSASLVDANATADVYRI
ncbi:MAG TPA: hypothetical protein VGK84_05665 [Candidatus Tumulicola sp.]